MTTLIKDPISSFSDPNTMPGQRIGDTLVVYFDSNGDSNGDGIVLNNTGAVAL